MMIDLDEMAENMFNVALQRQKNGANISISPLAMLKHCATEVVEATEAYVRYVQDSTGEKYDSFSSEIADIIACALIISNNLGIDIEKALMECYEKNRKRAEGNGDKK